MSSPVTHSDVLGARFWNDTVTAGPLPAQAAARGAPPHWLGHIGVDDVVGTTLRFVQRGATQLGPPAPTSTDVASSLLRDPFGAVVSVSALTPIARAEPVAWHFLSARDEAGAFAIYAELFGWVSLEVVDLGPERGCHVTFSWDGTTRAAGSTSNIARLPHVHPQWLFFFRTDDLDVSLARVRAGGGLALPVVATARGDLVAPCDDPQGAAFGLYQAITR
jgi:uncharacterized protein